MLVPVDAVYYSGGESYVYVDHPLGHIEGDPVLALSRDNTKLALLGDPV